MKKFTITAKKLYYCTGVTNSGEKGVVRLDCHHYEDHYFVFTPESFNLKARLPIRDRRPREVRHATTRLKL